MRAGGQYPEGYGEVKIHVFGKEEEEESELKVYSVLGSGQKPAIRARGLPFWKSSKRSFAAPITT